MKILNWMSYFYSMKITVFLILGILLIQHTWQCYSPTQNAKAIFFNNRKSIHEALKELEGFIFVFVCVNEELHLRYFIITTS